ncbi:hypothetical protein OQA88_1079 [Cercophora sp. LCS_1]
MVTLDRLPTEIISEILSQLRSVGSYGIERLRDIRNARLINRTIGAVATRLALKEVVFCLSEQDFGMLQELANDPMKAEQVTSLVYAVQVLYSPRQTFETYKRIIQDDDIDNLRLEILHPGHFLNWPGGVPPPVLSEDELAEHYQEYLRFYDQQQHILDDNVDYDGLKKVIAKFPNLQSVTMSNGNEFRIMPMWKTPFKSFRHGNDSWETDANELRHLRAILYGVQQAGTHLRIIQAGCVHFEFFEPDYFFDNKFNLQGIFGLLDNLTDRVVDRGS